MRRPPALAVPSSLLAAGALLCAGAGVLAPSASAAGAAERPGRHESGPSKPGHGKPGHREPTVRFATYNASLNRTAHGQLVADLATGTNAQAQAVAEVVQHTRPDVLLVNEFDHDDQGRAARLFRDRYLAVGQGGARGIDYPYWYSAPSNTGVPSGLDLDNDGTVGGGNDAFGFGEFPGQYGMVVYSRYPIQERQIRTFQRFRWVDMPGARLPDDPATAEPADWYSPAELAQVRLSSKSHWDVPIRVGRSTVHLLASHPTPPTFDGDEDRNGTRNADEIRFWADYVTGGRTARYVYDDRGRRGGLAPRSAFVVAGDLNSDPYDGDSVPGAVQQILEHPAVDADPGPTSAGAIEAARLQGGANASHLGPASSDTADFADGAPGNLRADYVLPGGAATGERAGVFWPVLADPLSRLTGVYPFPTSDHRLVWVDVRLHRS